MPIQSWWSISIAHFHNSTGEPDQNNNSNKEISDLKHSIEQLHLTILYRVYPEDTFFSLVQGTFSKIDHILVYKPCLNKYK